MRAYVFPGQGAQFPGMARDLYENSPEARRLLDRADEILGFKITEVMFGGSAEDLKQTAVTQPAVFLHSYLAFACNAVPAPDMVAGHSLGEFSALAAAGALGFEDALRLVSLRAAAMQKACELEDGTMAAIIGLDAAQVERICSETGMPRREVDSDAMQLLVDKSWTGNIRELRNVVERLLILSGSRITADDVRAYVL